MQFKKKEKKGIKYMREQQQKLLKYADTLSFLITRCSLEDDRFQPKKKVEFK